MNSAETHFSAGGRTASGDLQLSLGAKMTKTLHVIPRDGQWAVAREASKADRLFTTQRQAIETAKVIVKKEGSGQVVVHQRDGRVRAHDMYTYGMPPIQDPPGKKSAKIERAVDKITRDRLEADLLRPRG